MEKYYCNGWRESFGYIRSLGVSEKDIEMMRNGIVLYIGENTIWIESEE